MIRLGQRSDREIFCLIFFPVGILEIFSNFSHMYFSHLQVCGKKIRLGCHWVQGFQGRYMQCGSDFPQQTVKKGIISLSQLHAYKAFGSMCISLTFIGLHLIECVRMACCYLGFYFRQTDQADDGIVNFPIILMLHSCRAPNNYRPFLHTHGHSK